MIVRKLLTTKIRKHLAELITQTLMYSSLIERENYDKVAAAIYRTLSSEGV